MNRVALWGIVAIALAVLAFHFLVPIKQHPESLTQTKYGIALKYHLTEEQVDMDPKPAGCDFSDPPAGDKHCHFEANEYVEREGLNPNSPVKRVSVTWRKVRDP